MRFVDVLVPCYGYGHFLRECVTTVLAQSLENLRVLIIDDASPDSTAEVGAELAKQDARVTYVRHIKNIGHIATYNEGIAWASADYMLLLSADDYLLPGALQRAVDLMEAHPEVGFTFGKAIDLVKHGAVSQMNTLANTAVSSIVDHAGWSILSGVEFFELIESFGSVNIVRTPTVVVRTDLQKSLGGYRSELPHAGDMEMWLRLAAHASVGVLGSYQAVYRLHGSNMQNIYYRPKTFADLQQRKAAIDCIFRTCGLPLQKKEEFHRRLLTPLACEALRCASGALDEGDLEFSARLSAFAITIDPAIKTSLPWIVLNCKRRMGFRLSRALVPTVRKIRDMALRGPFA